MNLESTVIELIENDIERDGKEHTLTSFEMILEGCKMPKLIAFGLGSSAFTENGMTKFLQHSQQIKHLSFLAVRLMSGSWERIFHTIKGSLALETFEFKSLQGGVADSPRQALTAKIYEPYPAIEKILLGGGPNPFSVAALEHAATEQRKPIEKE